MAGIYAARPGLQRALHAAAGLIWPVTCMMCEERVEEEGALCPACWRATPFVGGTACDACGIALPGHDAGLVTCDECLATPRPWSRGRAALSYGDGARSLVLALKHGDRTDLARGAGRWMHRRGRDLIGPETLIVPVPIHRWRLLRRRYNQSALLAREIARLSGADWDPCALVRIRATESQDHRSVADRFGNVAGAIAPAIDMTGRSVLLIDDVLTSGATLAACSDAARAAGAARADVLVLARVAKDG